MMNQSRTINFFNLILELIFVCFIFLPLFGYIFELDVSGDLGEKRALARCPSFKQDTLQTIPEKFDAFYEDHFGFRSSLIQGHNWLKYKFLKSGSVGKVLLGRDGWLFLTKAESISDYLGLLTFSPQQLAAWKDALEQRRNWLADRGIHYLFFIAPNKTSIYPEMLPSHIGNRAGRTQMDQLVEYLRANSDVDFLDLRFQLCQAKADGLIYHPRDSHWTDRGAFIVYQNVIGYVSRWFPEIKPMTMDNFTITRQQRQEDLALMLGLGRQLAEEVEVFQSRQPAKAHRIELVLPEDYPWPRHMTAVPQWAMENKYANHRLLFFHDSFGLYGNLLELIADHFLRTVFIPLRPDMNCLKMMIEIERHDIVIEEIVERKLKDPPSKLLVED